MPRRGLRLPHSSSCCPAQLGRRSETWQKLCFAHRPPSSLSHSEGGGLVLAHTTDRRRPFPCQPCPALQLLSASETPRERRITVGLSPLNHLRVLLAFHSAVPMTLVHLALNLCSPGCSTVSASVSWRQASANPAAAATPAAESPSHWNSLGLADPACLPIPSRPWELSQCWGRFLCFQTSSSAGLQVVACVGLWPLSRDSVSHV